MNYRKIDLTDMVLINEAIKQAENGSEKNYLRDIIGRIAAAGKDLVLSDRQIEKLRNIADPEFPHTYGLSGLYIS